MRKIIGIILLTISCLQVFGQHEVRERTTFNYDWMFCKGDIDNAHAADYDDSKWRKLDVPHDWAIEGPFDKKHDARTGGLPISGTAWYRKNFFVDKTTKGEKITIEFDGVMDNSTVYINGHKVGERPFGYIGFEVDLTPFLKYGKNNVIAVKVDPKELSSRWYPGAGIYRNVWIEKKNKTHVAHWGTYITTPTVTNDQATVNVETNVVLAGKGKCQLKSTVLDVNGKIVAQSTQNISEQTTVTSIAIANPNRWDLDTPYLYTLKTQVIKDT